MHQLIVLSGVSGSGKTALSDIILGRHPHTNYARFRIPELTRVVTCTTRTPRTGEREGEHYFFRTLPEFEALWTAGKLLERAQPNDHHYGVLREAIDYALDISDALVILEGEGVLKAHTAYPESSLIYIEPPSREVIHARMRGRGDSKEVVAFREHFLPQEVAKLTRAVEAYGDRAYPLNNHGRIEEAAEIIQHTIECIRLKNK